METREPTHPGALVVAQPRPQSGRAARGRKPGRRARLLAVSPGHQTLLQDLPAWVWGLALALAVWGAFAANPLLTPCAILLLPLLASLLWFKGEPPVLLFVCAMQWLQSTAAIFYTNFHGMPLSGQVEFGGAQLVQATWLSLVGVLVLAVGMRLALMRHSKEVATKAAEESRLLQPVRIFNLYLIAFVVLSVVERMAFRIPALTQPLLATSALKWALVFLVAYSVLMQRAHYGFLVIVVCLEFISGILGFFAGFKTIFFMLLVVLPSARYVFKGWRLVQFCTLAALVLGLGVAWMIIKPDYREFLNQGSGQQVVLVSVEQRVKNLGELVTHINRAKLEAGLEDLVLRAAYVNYFALTIANVPSSVPHENGALWFGALKHIFTPRLLFPNKAELDDSARAAYYTGVSVAGRDEGTSIGIGYMGESYIDFGQVGMFAPIFLLGLFYGLVYRYFANANALRVIGLALAVAMILPANQDLPTSNIKVVGGNMINFIVLWLFNWRFGSWVAHLCVRPSQPRHRHKTGIKPDAQVAN
jgi:hypothetical protein